jgi:hypothetical protein
MASWEGLFQGVLGYQAAVGLLSFDRELKGNDHPDSFKLFSKIVKQRL